MLGVNVQKLAPEIPGHTTVDPSSSVVDRFGPVTTTDATSVVLQESRGAVESVGAYPGIETDDREILSVPRGFSGAVVGVGAAVVGVGWAPVVAGGAVGATTGCDDGAVALRGAVELDAARSPDVAVTFAAVGGALAAVVNGGSVEAVSSPAGSTV